MYDLINKYLKDHNFHRYEVSNWAKSGHECKHNLTYWRAEEYFAFGLSSHGYFKSQRFANTRDLNEYIKLYSTENLSNQSSVDNLYDHLTKIEIKEQLEEELLLNSD